MCEDSICTSEVNQLFLSLSPSVNYTTFKMPSSRLQLQTTLKNNVSKRNDTLYVLRNLQPNEIISTNMKQFVSEIGGQSKEELMRTVDGIKDAKHQLSLIQQVLESELLVRSTSDELSRLNRYRDITRERIMRREREIGDITVPPMNQAAPPTPAPQAPRERIMRTEQEIGDITVPPMNQAAPPTPAPQAPQQQ